MVVEALATISNDRYECYDNSITSNERIQLHSFDSKEKAQRFINLCTDRNKIYNKYRCVSGIKTDVYGNTYIVEDYQLPMYLMMILSGVMGSEINAIDFIMKDQFNLANKYIKLKPNIIIGYVSGIAHPHFTDAYIILAEGQK